ncbi:TetR/AcrR family transcriptional regulator [Bacillus sp. RG28]|uniref:TetR/AcrR family transcriptional regulator n=1 Tax=Gottfriedia endophytica TaxID=2820819 RepID=A0A940NX36_9BACI|nr:TetR/AcrR family transcriptional regulator [Gottfriedia endophytica]MBP0726583.1 TetR/AcrR family transcriptional regulator [Gottfriedia endophytica]
MPKVSEDYKERKRESLLESALKCFGEKGYQSTTMDDIVAYSNTSKGLIYNYFKSKEELYLTLMEERTNRTFKNLKERFEKFSTAKEKIEELFRIYKDKELTEDWRKLIRVHMEFWIISPRQENTNEIMSNRYKQYRDFLVQIIDEGKNAGEIKKEVQSDIVASIFWAFIDGTCLHYSVVGENYSYMEQFNKTEEMIMKYILTT